MHTALCVSSCSTRMPTVQLGCGQAVRRCLHSLRACSSCDVCVIIPWQLIWNPDSLYETLTAYMEPWQLVWNPDSLYGNMAPADSLWNPWKFTWKLGQFMGTQTVFIGSMIVSARKYTVISMRTLRSRLIRQGRAPVRHTTEIMWEPWQSSWERLYAGTLTALWKIHCVKPDRLCESHCGTLTISTRTRIHSVRWYQAVHAEAQSATVVCVGARLKKTTQLSDRLSL